MNRYYVLDFKTNCDFYVGKIDMDFKENDEQCGSASYMSRRQMLEEAIDFLKDLLQGEIEKEEQEEKEI